MNFEPLRSAWRRPAPFRSMAVFQAIKIELKAVDFPVNVASSKSPYDRFASLKSSSVFASPSVAWLHAIGQFLSPAGRALSMATVHGGAGGGGLGLEWKVPAFVNDESRKTS